MTGVATVLRHRTPSRALFEALEATGVSGVVEPSPSKHYTHTITAATQAGARKVAATLLTDVQVPQLLLRGRLIHVCLPA